MEAFTEVTKLVEAFGLETVLSAMMSHEIQPMGRLKTNQCFNNSYVT